MRPDGLTEEHCESPNETARSKSVDPLETDPATYIASLDFVGKGKTSIYCDPFAPYRQADIPPVALASFRGSVPSESTAGSKSAVQVYNA